MTAADVKAPAGRTRADMGAYGVAGLSPNRLAGRRIAHLILNLKLGGAERLAVDLAGHLRDAGAAPCVICFDSVDESYEGTRLLREKGVHVHFVPRRQMKFDPACLRALVARLRAERVELLHAHDLTSLSYAVAAGLRLRIPALMTEHSRHYLEERWLRRMEKRVLALGACRFVDVSPLLADASADRDGIPRRKIEVIPNGVDLDRLGAADGAPFRSEFGLGADELLVGVIGRLEPIKGPDVALEAMAGVFRAMPRARLVFVGEGGMAEELRAGAERLGVADKVLFAGMRADVPEILNALDVVLVPSRSEGLPFALLEAMGAARPVVATQVGFIPGVVEDGVSGLLVPPGEAKPMTHALTTLLLDPALRRTLGDAARETVRTSYSRAGMLDSYARLYARCLD